MKTIFKYVFAIISIFYYLLSQNSYCQISGTEKIYIPSAEGYFLVTDINAWSEEDYNNYSGKYEYIYPAYDEYGEWAGDGVSEEMSVNFSGNTISLSTQMRVEGWDEPESAISQFQYPSDFSKNYGKFIKLTYKDSSNRNITTKGLLTNTKNNNEYFFEKSKDAGHNAFFMFNKPMSFDYNLKEFQEMHPEFSFYEKDKTGSTVYKYSSSNSDGSGKYKLEVIFNQDLIKEMRLTGQRSDDFNEFDNIRFSIQDEFFYDRGTEINEKYSSFFEKNDIKAEINYVETTYITILWK